jgi:hypothetical protein
MAKETFVYLGRGLPTDFPFSIPTSTFKSALKLADAPAVGDARPALYDFGTIRKGEVHTITCIDVNRVHLNEGVCLKMIEYLYVFEERK